MKKVDGVHGNQTLGRWMVGADESTELWRPPREVEKMRTKVTRIT